MRNILTLFVLILTFSLIGCGNGNQINGRSFNTALRSVKVMKERLPGDMKHEFQLSFWTIRDAYKNTDEFLQQVDGKTPDAIIAEAKDIFQQRKTQGLKEYEKYSSWEDMINQFNEERMNQDRGKKTDPRDLKGAKEQSVDYKL